MNGNLFLTSFCASHHFHCENKENGLHIITIKHEADKQRRALKSVSSLHILDIEAIHVVS